MKRKFKKAFAPNPSHKYNMDPVFDMAESVYFASETPIYDVSMDDKSKFAVTIGANMELFDPENDVVLDSGDPVILVMMVTYLSELHDEFYFARYNSRAEKYMPTLVSKFEMNPGWEEAGGEEVYDD